MQLESTCLEVRRWTRALLLLLLLCRVLVCREEYNLYFILLFVFPRL